MKRMNNDKIKITVFLIALLSSFTIFLAANAADNLDNKVAIYDITMTGIKTGSGHFFDDGLDYGSDGYTSVTNYIAGKDSNDSNRLVRSFDSLTYNFNYNIAHKSSDEDVTDRKINITVKLTEEEAKYVAFDKYSKPGETSHTFTQEHIDSYSTKEASVTLYVLNAPNGFEIAPQFIISESTNTDNAYTVYLGKNDNKFNYSFDLESNRYSNVAETEGFNNYMPTVVSSVESIIEADVDSQDTEGQKATYNNQIGRFLNFVVGLKPDIPYDFETYGIKGIYVPTENVISIPFEFGSTGTPVVFKNEWARLYGDSANADDIENVIINMPYSSSTAVSSMKTKEPGTISVENNTLKVSDFAITYEEATNDASGRNINKAHHYFNTTVFTVFSPRTSRDGRNKIMVSMKAWSPDGSLMSYAPVINDFYELVDYNLTSEFTDDGGNKISKHSEGTGNGSGALSKGTSFIYKSVFNYKKTGDTQGLKEVFKIDSDAFRVISLSDKNNIRIRVSGDAGLSEDDFEVKFVSGSFDNYNYSINNDFSRITGIGETDGMTCPDNLSVLNKDKIQNIYGGPCIVANAGVEREYKSVYEAKISDEEEDPITKVIVQTKEGVVLPNNVEVTIEIGLRVRNMLSDITETHQATVVAMSSDYDNELTYYAPRIEPIDDNHNSVTDPDNYKKTIYEGSDIKNSEVEETKEIDTTHPWGDSLKIVNFTSRETVTVTNKNDDGSIKTDYSVGENETIHYKLSTVIEDYNMEVGADDVWYIDNLKVTVELPQYLTYVPSDKLGAPASVSEVDGKTYLVFVLPYTKPNQKIKDLYFDAVLDPSLNGVSEPLTVTATVEAININNEVDTSYFGYLSGSFTIYATEIKNVLPIVKVGTEGSVVEKNQEFSYVINAYNKTGEDVEDYTLIDILPVDGINDSKINGSYEVLVTLPDTQGHAEITCSKQDPKTLSKNPNNSNDSYSPCNITEEYEKVTAIRISNLNIDYAQSSGDIIVKIRPKDNNYSNTYNNEVYGKAPNFEKVKSNLSKVRVVSRNISGRVFVDRNEDGIEDKDEIYVKDLPVSLFLMTSGGEKKVAETSTNKNGVYKFNDLDEGTYKVRVSYPNSMYDLTLRYATEDYEHDSDAYKILDKDQEVAEIAYIRTVDDQDRVTNSLENLSVNRNRESVEDMNVGLIDRKEFGFKVDKYITKVDLNTTAGNKLLTYQNTKKVKLDVKNSLQATAKVYYEIKVTNDSTAAGYIKVVGEDIPNGLSFDSNDEYNKDWIDTNGSLTSIKYENDIIQPGDSRSYFIVLDMPRQETAATFINTATLLDIEQYIPETLTPDKDPNHSDSWEIGNEISYAGISWHVIKAVANESGEQTLTLLADDYGKGMAHTRSRYETYKWSESLINKYLNERGNKSFQARTSINPSILNDNIICDDASGLPVASNGGALQSQDNCQSGLFTTSKIRLLTEGDLNDADFRNYLNNSSDTSWFYNLNSDYNFWLMNADTNPPENYTPYGEPYTPSATRAKYVNVTNGTVNEAEASQAYRVRPVIEISSRHIIAD